MQINIGDFVVFNNNKIYTITNVVNSYTYEITYYETPGDIVLDEEELKSISGCKLVTLADLAKATDIISKDNTKKIEKLFQK